MKLQNLLAGFVLVIFLQSPLVLAISCNSVSPANYNTCLEILNSKLSESEKEILISNIQKSYLIKKSSDGWKIGNKIVGVQKFEPLHKMNAFGFYDVEVQNFEPLQKINITKVSGEIFEWHIGQKIENYYLAKRADRNEIYKISSVKAEKIIKFLEKNSRK